MRYEILDENNNIINTIIADQEFVEQHYPNKWRKVEINTPIIKVVPEVVSRFQAKTALYSAGLLDEIDSLINNPETNPITKIAWNDAQEFRRHSELVLSVAQQLNWTDEQLDQLFIDASNITA